MSMRGIVAAIVGAALLALAATPVSAMNFKFGTIGLDLTVIVAKGDIDRGDARKLARALEKAGTDRHGTKVLYLESDGGLVSEALKMADIMREVGVTTIVRKDTVCASACASVLFVSGKYRTVEKGGMLAIHSCVDVRSGRVATHCNAVISAHAESVGVNGVAMMALQEAAGRDTVIVFNTEDAACFGLTLKPGARPSKKQPKCVRELTGQ
jgi:hypothetical protein